MAKYHFLTTWDVQAPIQSVWEVIADASRYPDWWKYVASVKVIEPVSADGTGGLFIYRWKTALPYSLEFEVRTSRFEPPNVSEGQVHGELDGAGRWELSQMDGFTRLTYDWNVATTKAWMNLAAPLARPVFNWNHNIVMTEGGRALAELLGVKLLDYKNETL